MRIVSYSFFRSAASVYESPSWNANKIGRQFEQFLPLLLRAHHVIWSDWEMWVYHDRRVTQLPYWPALKNCAAAGLVKLIPFGECDAICGQRGMLARMRPLFESDTEYVACRDVDSIPLPRDRAAVEEFIASGHAIHVIHSAGAHSGLMGGTIAVKCSRFRELIDCNFVAEMIHKFGNGIDFTKHGSDQHLLNRLPPLVGKETLIHELHHKVGDLPGEVRTAIADPKALPKIRLDEFLSSLCDEEKDSFSKIIGGCEEPLPALRYYDSLTLWAHIREIRDCERAAGIDAVKLLEEIAAL